MSKWSVVSGGGYNGAAPGGGSVSGTAALTVDLPIFGANGNLVKTGTKTGNTNEVVSATGTATSGYVLLYDASGNAIARQPRGNTTVAQLADSTTHPTTNNLAKFDANGNIADSGFSVTTIFNFSDEETPSGALDGSNQTYTLAHTPNPVGSLRLFLNGILQLRGGGKDYTISGVTVTFVSARSNSTNNEWLMAYYRY